MKKMMLLLTLILTACTSDETPKDSDVEKTPESTPITDTEDEIVFPHRELKLSGVNPDELIIFDHDFDNVYTVIMNGTEVNTGASLVIPVGDGSYIGVKDNLYGILDEDFNELIPMEYERVRPMSFGTVPAKMNSLWGVVDEFGIVIDFQYEFVFPSIVEDVYLVYSDPFETYFVNKFNEKISDSFWIKAINTSIGHSVMQDMYYVEDEHLAINDDITFESVIVSNNDLYGVYGFDGNVIIPVEYRYIEYLSEVDLYIADIYDDMWFVESIIFNSEGVEVNRLDFQIYNDFHDGYLLVDGVYYDDQFNSVYTCEYWSCSDMYGEQMVVSDGSNTYAIANMDGLVTEMIYDEISYSNDHFRVRMGNDYYIMDELGTVLSSPYEELSMLERGYAFYLGDTYGVIDRSGEVVFDSVDYIPFFARDDGAFVYNINTYNYNLIHNGDLYSDMDFSQYYIDAYIINELFEGITMSLFSSDGNW